MEVLPRRSCWRQFHFQLALRLGRRQVSVRQANGPHVRTIMNRPIRLTDAVILSTPIAYAES